MEIYHPWMISESWYLILHPFLWLSCIYWTPMSNSKHPVQLSNALHKQLCLLELFQQGSRPSQGAPMHFVGWTPPPMRESQWCPTRFQRLKRTNKGHLTYSICYTWVWSSFHFNFVFFFTWSKTFFHSTFALHVGRSRFEHS
jgi:hypothetical protein